MSNPTTPLKDVVILKNAAITRMPLSIIAKNHAVSPQLAARKARNMAAAICDMVENVGVRTIARCLHLTVAELETIIAYHAAHEGLQQGLNP